MKSPVHHHMTIDVEEFFHASALEPFIPRVRWDGMGRRSPRLVGRLLRHLEETQVRATFFILGWLAEREPELVRTVADAGHEVASHGWDHRRVHHLSREEFREDVRRSKNTLEEVTSREVVGYRAPSFSIVPGHEWALDILIEEGFRYDSSMFPVKVHPGYGYPDSHRDPHVIRREAGDILEVPPATLRLGTMNLPAAGGAYLRFFPVGLVHKALADAEARGAPGTVYLHPWELDDDMPSFQAPWKTQLRMRGGIQSVAGKLSTLTRRFRFRPVVEMALAGPRAEGNVEG